MLFMTSRLELVLNAMDITGPRKDNSSISGNMIKVCIAHKRNSKSDNNIHKPYMTSKI